jgi:hypothetical protein
LETPIELKMLKDVILIKIRGFSKEDCAKYDALNDMSQLVLTT